MESKGKSISPDHWIELVEYLGLARYSIYVFYNNGPTSMMITECSSEPDDDSQFIILFPKAKTIILVKEGVGIWARSNSEYSNIIVNQFFIPSIGNYNQILSSSLFDNLLFDGRCFTYSNYFQFDTDQERAIFIDPTQCECSKVFLLPLLFAAVSGPGLVDIYANPIDVTGGVPIVPINRCGPSGRLSQMNLKMDVNFSEKGIKLPLSRLIPATGVSIPVSSGASGGGVLPFESNMNSTYLITILNKGATGAYISIDATWNEANL